MPRKPTIAPRKPTRAPDPILAEKFLEGAEQKTEPEQKLAEVRQLREEPEAPKEPPKSAATQPTPQKPLGRRIYQRKRDGRKLRQTTVYLDPTLAKKLAYHCIDVEQDQSTIINEAVRLYLGTNA